MAVTCVGTGPWWGVVLWGEVVDVYRYVSVTNNNQPPRVGCLLAEKRVVALEMSIVEVGGACLYQKYNETHDLPVSIDTDDWVVMEELRPRRRQRIMQQ